MIRDAGVLLQRENRIDLYRDAQRRRGFFRSRSAFRVCETDISASEGADQESI